MFQSMTAEGMPVPYDLLVKDVPPEKHQNLDYIVDMIDWLENLDENFKKNHYLTPVSVMDTKDEGYQEKWIVYGTNNLFSAKELTVFPEKSVKIKDSGPYGLIVIQGHGSVEKLPVESPVIIKYNDLTYDELFVSYDAAKNGVTVTNEGHENLVILKHFGPGGNPARERESSE